MIDARLVINSVVEAAMHSLFLALSCDPIICLEQRFSSTFKQVQHKTIID
jgi:hypothetical protein